MRAEVLRDWSQVEALGEEWNELLRASRADSIFLTWEWIGSWLEAGGRRFSPSVILVRDEGGLLAGLAPLYAMDYELLGALPYRILRTAGDWESGAEYLGWLIRRGRPEVGCEIARTLAREAGAWDGLWIPHVAEWTGAGQEIREAAAGAGLRVRARPGGFGAMALPSEAGAFLSSLGSARRAQIRRQARKVLERPGACVGRCTGRDEVSGYLEGLFRLHHLRWMTRGDRGTFERKPRERDFFLGFVPRALERGWLRLFGLWEGGELKAVQLGYLYNGAYCQIQEGFDPDYIPGAGNVLRLKVIEALIEEGVRSYDFLGEYSEHKRAWGAQYREGSNLFIGHRRPKSWLLQAGDIWPTGRFLRPTPRN